MTFRAIRVCQAACVALASGLLAVGAQAGTITYSDFSSWSAAVSGPTTTVTIPDPSPESFINFGTDSGSVTYGGVTFSTTSGVFFNVGSLFSGNPAVLSSQTAASGTENILITLPIFTNALSLDYGTFDGSDVTFLLSNGHSFTQGSTGSGYLVPDFFGTDPDPFNTVFITLPTPDGVLNLNSISFAGTVPEPASMALLGSALIGFGVARRRRKTA